MSKFPKLLKSRPEKVTESIQRFDNFCHRFSFEENRATGSSNDLDLLGYCEYETGLPGGDSTIGSHVWANMVVNSGAACWAEGNSGELYLVAPDATEDWHRWSFEVKPMCEHYWKNDYIQYEAFGILTQFFIIHSLLGGSEPSEIKGLLDIWKSYCEDNMVYDYTGDQQPLIYAEGDIFRRVAQIAKVIPRITRPNKSHQINL